MVLICIGNRIYKDVLHKGKYCWFGISRFNGTSEESSSEKPEPHQGPELKMRKALQLRTPN